MYAIGAYCSYTGYAGKVLAGTEMVIIETSIFTRRVLQLLADEEYRKRQAALVNRPKAGAIIRGSGGLRKVRRVGSGRGKRGGVRIIYYWTVEQAQLLMLFIFAKNERDDLSPDQVKMLRTIVEDDYP
jgi:mRNA-degrading endonuclease RelE of RelBE toxin-antitoxin system